MSVDLNEDQRTVGIDECIPNDWNTNEMDQEEFNLLASRVQQDGFVDPIQVVPEGDQFRIVGGEHRWRVLKALGSEEIRVTVLDRHTYDEDRQKFLSVSLNVLHGRMNPEKFARLYSDLGDRYADEVLAQMMGFAREAELEKLIDRTIKGLPPGLRDKARAARKEIRTVDDLSNLLNHLFTEYGQTLPSNVMAFTYGGRDVMMVLADKRLWSLATGLMDATVKDGGDVAKAFADAIAIGVEHGEQDA